MSFLSNKISRFTKDLLLGLREQINNRKINFFSLLILIVMVRPLITNFTMNEWMNAFYNNNEKSLVRNEKQN